YRHRPARGPTVDRADARAKLDFIRRRPRVLCLRLLAQGQLPLRLPRQGADRRSVHAALRRRRDDVQKGRFGRQRRPAHRDRQMRRRLALAVAVALCAAIGGGVWLAREAYSRAELVSPRPTEIVYDREGVFLTQIAHGDSAGYGYWPLEKIPRRFALATLALEDRRFYSHGGVDPRAILRAAWNNLFRRNAREG